MTATTLENGWIRLDYYGTNVRVAPVLAASLVNSWLVDIPITHTDTPFSRSHVLHENAYSNLTHYIQIHPQIKQMPKYTSVNESPLFIPVNIKIIN